MVNVSSPFGEFRHMHMIILRRGEALAPHPRPLGAASSDDVTLSARPTGRATQNVTCPARNPLVPFPAHYTCSVIHANRGVLSPAPDGSSGSWPLGFPPDSSPRSPHEHHGPALPPQPGRFPDQCPPRAGGPQRRDRGEPGGGPRHVRPLPGFPRRRRCRTGRLRGHRPDRPAVPPVLVLPRPCSSSGRTTSSPTAGPMVQPARPSTARRSPSPSPPGHRPPATTAAANTTTSCTSFCAPSRP